MTAPRVRKHWGFGFEGEGPDPAQLALVEAALGSFLGLEGLSPVAVPALGALELRAPRVAAPAGALGGLLSSGHAERVRHSYGNSYRDVVRALRGEYPSPPDLVAFPTTEAEVVALLDWASGARVAVIPFGGGTSVCGGVEPSVSAEFAGTLSLDLGRLDRVLEVDAVSRAARVQAGVLGPSLEAQLRPHGLSLRHFPQSFECSSLGGWVATRAGGHFATLHTHIDELVQALRVVTPAGALETRRLPGDGAGPQPERLFIGSEGALGVITEAWVRLFERPRFRASFTSRHADFEGGARALRALAQSGLYPANCRLLDPLEALMNGVAGGEAVLLVAFESHDHPLGPWAARAAELCRDHGGTVGPVRERDSAAEGGERDGAAGAWRAAFLRGPYLRDELVRRGVFVETFETAVTWDRFSALVAGVRHAAEEALRDLSCPRSVVSCRVTHAYPDGAAPYFTVIAPARPGEELRQLAVVKGAITDAFLAHGGTVTHHHAVGRDVRSHWERQRPALFGAVLGAAKRTLDPAGVMNPGVLLP